MYIISMIDTFPDGSEYAPIQKLTKMDSINYVRDSFRTIHKASSDIRKKNFISQLIQRTGTSCLSCSRTCDDGTVAYDIVDSNEWERKQKELIDSLNKEIGDLIEFIRENEEKIKELEKGKFY